MTIILPADLEQRLKTEAERHGVDPAEYAKTLLERALPQPGAPDQSTLALFAQWDAEDWTDDPEEIARRNREFEEFKEAMNRNRLEMEGPNARKLFP